MASIAFGARNITTTSPTSGIRAALSSIVQIVAERRRLVQTRTALQRLSDYELEDIGIVRADIEQIAREKARRT